MVYGYQNNQYMNSQYMMPQQRQEVVKVNGENGAMAYQIGANSSALLLDVSGLMIWLVVTDGAGYKTVTAYDITPHQMQEQPNFLDIEKRLSEIEKRLGVIENDANNPTAAAEKQPRNGAK